MKCKQMVYEVSYTHTTEKDYVPQYRAKYIQAAKDTHISDILQACPGKIISNFSMDKHGIEISYTCNKCSTDVDIDPRILDFQLHLNNLDDAIDRLE